MYIRTHKHPHIVYCTCNMQLRLNKSTSIHILTCSALQGDYYLVAYIAKILNTIMTTDIHKPPNQMHLILNCSCNMQYFEP